MFRGKFQVDHDVTLFELENPRAGNVQRHATVRLQTRQTNELKQQKGKKRKKNEKRPRPTRTVFFTIIIVYYDY